MLMLEASAATGGGAVLPLAAAHFVVKLDLAQRRCRRPSSLLRPRAEPMLMLEAGAARRGAVLPLAAAHLLQLDLAQRRCRRAPRRYEASSRADVLMLRPVPPLAEGLYCCWRLRTLL